MYLSFVYRVSIYAIIHKYVRICVTVNPHVSICGLTFSRRTRLFTCRQSALLTDFAAVCKCLHTTSLKFIYLLIFSLIYFYILSRHARQLWFGFERVDEHEKYHQCAKFAFLTA